MNKASKTIKILCLSAIVSIFANTFAMEVESKHSWNREYSRTEETIQAILNAPSYPPAPISSDNGYFHLLGFPTFLEITQAGAQKLEKDKKQSPRYTIDLVANINGYDKPVIIYCIDYIMYRVKNPGIYQPDYLPFDGKDYLTGYDRRFGDFEGDSKLKEDLSKKIHKIGSYKEVYDIDYENNKVYWGSETSYIGFAGSKYYKISEDFEKSAIEKPAKNNLVSLGGLFYWGAPYDPITTSYFENVAYHEGMRGIVFKMDAENDTWQTSCREVTEGDLSYLRIMDELKTEIKTEPELKELRAMGEFNTPIK